MTTSPSHRAQEILMTFAAEGEPTPKRLEAFTKEYPDLRRELTDLAVELVLEPSRPVPAADAATARTVSSAWARFQAGIASPPAKSRAGAVVEPSPDVFAGFAGPSFPRLAARLGVTPAFLIKVREGLIEAASFPKALARDIADEVGHGVDTVIALLERPASMPAGTMAKADGKPEVGVKQTFEEAVASSGLTADQRRRLLAMAEAERGSD